MKVDDNLWRGVDSLLDNYVMLHADDLVLLLFTGDSCEAAVWVSTVLTMRGIRHRRMWMAPIVDPDFAERLEQILPDPDDVAGRVVVLTFERDTMSHSRTLATALDRYGPGKWAVFRSISACASLFRNALQARPEDLSSRNVAILDRCMTAHRLRIRTRGGTDLEVGIDSERYRWISNRGLSSNGGTVILPAGEVATFPASIRGRHVADFAFNVNAITGRDVRLARRPVILDIEDGRVIDCRCDDSDLMRFLEMCLDQPCAWKIGELGFGTNFHVGRAIAMNSHINERRPGVHIGVGQHNQSSSAVGYRCAVHLDLIARGGKIWVDDDPVPINLERLPPSSNPHPDGPRDEDIFSPETEDLENSDCCGILTDGGLRPIHHPFQ